jgi:superfamily I DNA and/or RNA helicase
MPNPSILEFNSKEWDQVELSKMKKSNLNSSQIRAILTSLYAPELALIQGPPGTGKSTVIAEIIHQHILKKPQQKILLTSETHMAVDNAMEKLIGGLNSLVKPIRFTGKDAIQENNEIDVENEGQGINKPRKSVENEGMRYSLSRINEWVETDFFSDENKFLQDNAVAKWMQKIASTAESTQTSETELFIGRWKAFLEVPCTNTKQLFRDQYIQFVNVIGATSSSIGVLSTENKPTGFLINYDAVFQSENAKIKARKGLNAVRFDLVIVDEASKATPPELALPLIYGERAIIVGDHRQLPPLLDGEDFATTLEAIGQSELATAFRDVDHNISHFEKLFLNPNLHPTNRATFDLQYRMHPDINDAVKQFYEQDGGLSCGLSASQVDSSDLSNSQSRWHGLSYEGFIDPSNHIIWVNVETPEIVDGFSRINLGEVESCRWVMQLLKESSGFQLFQNFWTKPEDQEVAIITFYKKQAQLLEQMAKDFEGQIPTRVKSVDKFQGMERNIVLVSLVRSNKIASFPDQSPDFITYPNSGYPYQPSLGFAEMPNRLNVALSRAKRLLIIVGNANHFCKNPIYRKVFEIIQNNPNGRVIDFQTLANNYHQKHATNF